MTVEVVTGPAAVVVVVAVEVTVDPGTVEVDPGSVVVSVVPGAVVVLVTVFVVLGRRSKSPPKPRPIPTIPAAAKAPLHFSTLLLEALLFAKLSSFSGNIH